jgi:hypothetical protein
LEPAIKVAVVTSRLRRLIASSDEWLWALRGVLRKILEDRSTLVIGDGTAGAEFVRHAAIRLGIPFEVAVCPSDSSDDDRDVPIRDELVLTNADLVYVLGLRTGGNLHSLLRDRLQKQPGTVVLIEYGELQADAARQELCDSGAQSWMPLGDVCVPFERQSTPSDVLRTPDSSTQNDVYLIVPFPPDDGWEFLTHTTRSCPGPWPDETFEAYADSLLDAMPSADHSPLGTLRRIVDQKRLVASNQTIRGGHAVVSFSACPLGQLPTLHRFRPHRVRWDFEPYGLCIRREWLIAHGARPACYGDESIWESMPEADKPFFQRSIGESGVDWTVEREWRHLGHLDLTDLTPDDVLLFVPTFEAAKSLAQITKWPITLWPDAPKIH